MKGCWQAWKKSMTRFGSANFVFKYFTAAKRWKRKFHFECTLDFSKIASNPQNVIDVICQLFTFDLKDIWKVLDEILSEVKAKLMLFEGVGLIFTRGCSPFYQLSMNFIIYKILCSFATTTKVEGGKTKICIIHNSYKIIFKFLTKRILISYKSQISYNI